MKLTVLQEVLSLAYVKNISTLRDALMEYSETVAVLLSETQSEAKLTQLNKELTYIHLQVETATCLDAITELSIYLDYDTLNRIITITRG